MSFLLDERVKATSTGTLDEFSQHRLDPDAAFAGVVFKRDPALVETVQHLYARHGILAAAAQTHLRYR